MSPFETPLLDVLQELGIDSDDWEVLIATDGSATTWKLPAGWGSILVRRDGFERPMLTGSMSYATNNVAELMAVVHPLLYLVEQDEAVREHGLTVDIITDSSYVVKGIEKVDEIWADRQKANRMLWASVAMAKRSGLVLRPRLVTRNIVGLQKLMHEVANQQRLAQAEIPLPADPENVNPV